MADYLSLDFQSVVFDISDHSYFKCILNFIVKTIPGRSIFWQILIYVKLSTFNTSHLRI